MDKKRSMYNYSKVQDMNLKIKMNKIAKIVCDYYDLPIDVMTSRCRVQRQVKARMVAWYFIRESLACSLKDMGNHFNRDHTSILHGLSVIKNCIDTKSYVYDDLIDIRQIINNSDIKDFTVIDLEIPNELDWRKIVTDITGRYKTIKYHVHK